MNDQPINCQMTRSEWAMLLTLSLVWGGSFFFNSVAVRELPAMTIVLARVGLAGAALLIYLRIVGLAMPRMAAAWRAFFFLGLLNNVVPFCLIVWAQGHITSGQASILNATTPLFTVLIAHVMTGDERMQANRLGGVVIGFVGVAVMVGVEELQAAGATLAAQAAVLGAAISYGFAIVYARRFRPLGIKPIVTATGQVLASSILLLPLVLFVDRPWTLPMPGMPTFLSLIGIALLSTALAYGLYFRILSTAGATNASLVTMLIPPSAIGLGILFLGETLRLQHFLGLVLIIVGLLVIDGRLAALRRASD